MVTTVELVRARQAELRASAVRAGRVTHSAGLRDVVRRLRHRDPR